MLKYLVPFLISTAVYFFLLLPSGKPSLLALIIKCLPIYSLAVAAYFHGKSKRSRSGFNKLIIYGLLSSSIGDAFLIWEYLFPLGMVAFAVAHFFYIMAFGFNPLKPLMGLILYSISVFMMMIILPNIKNNIIFYGIPIYGLFLTTMSWRALAFMTEGPNAWSLTKVACGIGSVLFIISDTIICFHDLQKPIPYGQMLIMTTYYAAQLGITLSVVSNSIKTNQSHYKSNKKYKKKLKDKE